MTDKWYAFGADEIIARFRSDAENGLQPKEVRARLRREGANEIFTPRRSPVFRCAAEVLSDLTTVLLLLTVILTAAFGNGTDAAVVCVLVIASWVLETAVYARSQRDLENAARFCAPSARVIRGGKLTTSAGAGLVRGDILILSAGDSVPCDCRVIMSNGLKVSEKNITDNIKPVFKYADKLGTADLPPHKQSNMLFAGSSVIAGTCKAIAVETGEDTFVSSERGGVYAATHENLKLLASLRTYCRALGAIMLAAVLLITLGDALFGRAGRTIDAIFITGLALAVASMSNFFTIIGRINIASAVRRAARGNLTRTNEIKGTVIKNISSISDMRGVKCVAMNAEHALRVKENTIRAYFAGGKLFSSPADGAKQLGELIFDASLTRGAAGVSVVGDADAHDTDYDVTADLFEMYGSKDRSLSDYVIVGRAAPGFEGCAFYLALVYRGGVFTAVSKGDMRLLARCERYVSDGKVLPLDVKTLNEIGAKAAALEREGCTVTFVAHRESPYNTLCRIPVLQSELILDGFYAVSYDMAPGAAQTLYRLREAGINCVIISERDDMPSRWFAAANGFVSNVADVVTDADIAGLTDEELLKIAEKHDSYAALSPVSLKRLITALEKTRGRTVYAGSGQREAQAIATAGIGIACETEGAASGPARAAADALVRRADRDGGGITEVSRMLSYARSVYINTKNAAKYMCMSQTARLIIVTAAVVFGFETPSPVQLLYWGLLLDMAAVLSIAVTKPPADILRMPEIKGDTVMLRRDIVASVISGAAWALLLLSTPFVMHFVENLLLNKPDAAAITFAGGEYAACIFVSAAASAIVVAAEESRDKSVFAPGATASSMYVLFAVSTAVFVSLVITGTRLADIFNVTDMSLISGVGTVVPSVVMFIGYEIFKWITMLKNNNGKAQKKINSVNFVNK